MSVLACRRAIMGSIVQPKRSCLGLSRCCHMLVTVHAGTSQGYVLGIPLYPTGRSSTWTGPLGLGLGLGLGLAHSCMYCDQPSLLTRDPGGGVNEEIPHRWTKQPPRYIYYERSEFLIVGDGKNSTQKNVRRRRTRCNYWPIKSLKTTLHTVRPFPF